MPTIPTTTIIFNGPPSTGKDMVVNKLHDHFGEGIIARHQFKKQLFVATCDHYNLRMNDFMSCYSEKEKNNPRESLGGLSPRQAMIKVSEDILKPLYGEDYFGQMAAQEIAENRVNLFSDGGFLEEIKPIDIVSDNLLIVQLYRKGCTFENDSRSYIGKPEKYYGWGDPKDYQYERRVLTTTYQSIAYLNNGSIKDFYEFAKSLVALYADGNAAYGTT
jgi:hypothetical protein